MHIAQKLVGKFDRMASNSSNFYYQYFSFPSVHVHKTFVSVAFISSKFLLCTTKIGWIFDEWRIRKTFDKPIGNALMKKIVRKTFVSCLYCPQSRINFMLHTCTVCFVYVNHMNHMHILT